MSGSIFIKVVFNFKTNSTKLVQFGLTLNAKVEADVIRLKTEFLNTASEL